MKMKKITLIILTILLTNIVTSQELKLNTDWEKTKQIAQQENKDILIILTGSEWCAPCKKMDKKVFNNIEFQNYTEKNLVLFIVDLPRELDVKSEIYIRYQKFERDYDAKSLPALILADKDGNKIRNLKGRMSSLKNVMKQLTK
jgi:thioredoxin-related protein